MDQQYIESTLELMDFIADSPSCYHVVKNVEDILLDAGFTALDERKSYEIEKGKSYFVSRNSSSLIAFRVPEDEIKGYSIIASHTDSPTFKVKENPEIATGSYSTLNVEAYGGMIMSPWFDRPLSLAGRAFVKCSSGIEERLINIDKDFCQIVNLCIHQNKEVNKGFEYKVQRDLLPIFANCNASGSLRTLIAETLEVNESDLLDYELFLYNRMHGSIWGLNNEFFSAPKIDDLMCLFSSVKAITSCKKSDRIQMICLFDDEEVGSSSKQGAASDFMVQTVGRIGEALHFDYQKRCTLQADSFMVSADNGHSMHPNYPEKCDPVNRPAVNLGVLIKYAGNQNYTTDAYSASYLKNLLSTAGIPFQVFFNNSSVTAGSTLGNICQHGFSVPCIDIGVAMLAMHSPYETAGTKDTLFLTEAMKTVFEN